MRDLRVAFWTNKGNFALCPTSFREVAATRDSAPRPCALLKKVVGNICAFCQRKTFVSTLISEVFGDFWFRKVRRLQGDTLQKS